MKNQKIPGSPAWAPFKKRKEIKLLIFFIILTTGVTFLSPPLERSWLFKVGYQAGHKSTTTSIGDEVPLVTTFSFLPSSTASNWYLLIWFRFFRSKHGKKSPTHLFSRKPLRVRATSFVRVFFLLSHPQLFFCLQISFMLFTAIEKSVGDGRWRERTRGKKRDQNEKGKERMRKGDRERKRERGSKRIKKGKGRMRKVLYKTEREWYNSIEINRWCDE